VLTIAGIATAVVLYEGSLEAGLLPPVFRTIAVNTKAAGGMTSFALSLLLVFRTNASYARWDEARKIWGGVVNRTRDLARQGFTFFRTETPEDRALVAAHERWCIAFPKALMAHLRKDVDLRTELEGVLLPDELEKLLSCTHRPNYVARVLGVIVRNAQIPDPNVFRMGENITFFADACGACERIFKTPIPLSWTRHTSRFLMIWLASVPFSLYDTCKWATIPAAAMIAFLLLGIEEIGVSIEEPFSILPLEVITDTIKANILEMSDDLDEVEALVDVRQLTAGTGGNGYSKQLTGATTSVYASKN
jgi:predicted membrane chloride channel (bestrophin family)